MLSRLGWVFTDSLNSFPHQEGDYPEYWSQDIIQGTSPISVLFLLSSGLHSTWSSSSSASDLASYLTEASTTRFLNLTFLNLSLNFHTSSLPSVLAEKGDSLLFQAHTPLVLLNIGHPPTPEFSSIDCNCSLRSCVTSSPSKFFSYTLQISDLW